MAYIAIIDEKNKKIEIHGDNCKRVKEFLGEEVEEFEKFSEFDEFDETNRPNEPEDEFEEFIDKNSENIEIWSFDYYRNVEFFIRKRNLDYKIIECKKCTPSKKQYLYEEKYPEGWVPL